MPHAYDVGTVAVPCLTAHGGRLWRIHNRVLGGVTEKARVVSYTPVRECGYRIRGSSYATIGTGPMLTVQTGLYIHGHLGKLRHGDSGAKSATFWTDPASAFPALDFGRYAHKEQLEMVQAWTC
jgi:hypothetical protein